MTRPRTNLVHTHRSPGQRAQAQVGWKTVPVLFCALLLGAALPAQVNLQLGTTSEHEMPETGLEASDGELQLTLEDAISLALERNLGLAVERFRRSQTLLGALSSLSIYDLGVSATLGRSSSSRPQSSSLELTDGGSISDDTTTYNWGLQQLIPWGGTASVFYGSSRRSSSDQTNLFNPNYGLGLTFQVQQPLLQNFGREATERGIIQARLDNDINLHAFQIQVDGLIEQVSDAYWNLVEAKEQLEVAEESLKLAEELHEMNKIQVEVGTKAPLETVQSEATVAAREGDIISFTAQVEDNEDTLRRLVNIDQGDLWNVPILPVTEPESAFIDVDVKAAVRQALETRPELAQQRLTIQRRSLDSRYFRKQKRPSLDLTASYGPSATGGQVRTTDGVVLLDDDYFDTVSSLLDRDFDGWNIQLDFRYAFQNRAAKAQSAIADLALEESELQFSSLEQDILLDVRQAARAVVTAEKRLEAARVASKLARKNLEAEQKRYENGLATSFTLLDIQEDLSRELRNEVSAVIAYRTALVRYARARGMLLDEMGVELVSVGE